jgi:ribonuclease VapC
MMIDASALCAILLREPEAENMAERIASAESPFTSPIALYEAVVAWDADQAEKSVRRLLETASIEVRPISDNMASLAATAFHRFGKGRHPAALNLGDCFAYACAKANDVALLYKGDDFSKTDI